jgi:outer membrane lipoprotein-sorting protein
MMGRFLGLALAVLMAMAAPASAQKFRQGDASMIPKAEQALRQIGVMQADFTFQNIGQFNTGRLFVDRLGGKMRMEFDSPLNHLIIANGARVDFRGGDGTVVNTATQSTPLGLVFGREAKLSGDVQVLEIAAKGQNAYIAVGQRSKPKQGKVILHFLQTSPTWTLYGWGFIDPKGRYTKTILQNVRHGGELSWTLFEAPETN